MRQIIDFDRQNDVIMEVALAIPIIGVFANVAIPPVRGISLPLSVVPAFHRFTTCQTNTTMSRARESLREETHVEHWSQDDPASR